MEEFDNEMAALIGRLTMQNMQLQLHLNALSAQLTAKDKMIAELQPKEEVDAEPPTDTGMPDTIAPRPPVTAPPHEVEAATAPPAPMPVPEGAA